jgi:sporulation protein YlmC with PRC-barrel domain
MLRSLRDLERYTVTATDGDVGTVVNFLLDDERWIVRYLVVEPGLFHDGRRVLISPVFFRQAEWATHCFHLALTKDKIWKSPSVDVNKPVSRQHERDYFRHYGYPYYWGYSGLWGMGNYPGLLAPWDEPPADRKDVSGDVHLRSAKEVVGYDIHGSDGAIGSVVDFVVDDETWRIQYLVIDTSHWWFGKRVLVAPEWASRVSWQERKVYVDLSRQAIKDSPAWHPEATINREYEERLYDYYGRPAYWGDGGRRGEATARQHPGSHPGVR